MNSAGEQATETEAVPVFDDLPVTHEVPTVSFRTRPEDYQHWRLSVDGDIATLTLDVNEQGAEDRPDGGPAEHRAGGGSSRPVRGTAALG